ncbi:MAG: hypothetical protein ACOX3W_02265 [Christensenellaceae bacterium]|jgi:fatty acid/phospholipid biosynthesis enzyme
MAEKKGLLAQFKKSALWAKEKASVSVEQSRLRTQFTKLDEENALLYQKIGEQVYRASGEVIEKKTFKELIAQIEANYKAQQEVYFKLAELTYKEEGTADGAQLQEEIEEATEKEYAQLMQEVAEEQEES